MPGRYDVVRAQTRHSDQHPWRDLTTAQREWVLEGEGSWEDRKWYGVKRFFDWLTTKSYKMHVRVLLSRYRSYVPCKACSGARLKPDALLWRLPIRVLWERFSTATGRRLQTPPTML